MHSLGLLALALEILDWVQWYIHTPHFERRRLEDTEEKKKPEGLARHLI